MNHLTSNTYHFHYNLLFFSEKLYKRRYLKTGSATQVINSKLHSPPNNDILFGNLKMSLRSHLKNKIAQFKMFRS